MQKKTHSLFVGAGSQRRGCAFSSIGRKPAARRRRRAPESSWHVWKERTEDRMKKTLEYFTIDGAVGGNQEWFKNVVMYIGGCAAATACDCCIYLALRRGMRRLYPFDVEHLTREDYVAFSMKMKPYLRPRVNGVNKLYMFTEGFGKYLSDAGEDVLLWKNCPEPGAARRRRRLSDGRSTADILYHILCSATGSRTITILSGTGSYVTAMRTVKKGSGSPWRRTGRRPRFS